MKANPADIHNVNLINFFSKHIWKGNVHCRVIALFLYKKATIILIPVWLDKKFQFSTLLFIAQEIFSFYTHILRINLLIRVQIVSTVHKLLFTKEFFDGSRKEREGEKLSDTLISNMQAIDPKSLHWNVDLMTKPTMLHKQTNQQHCQVSKSRFLLLLLAMLEDNLKSICRMEGFFLS